MTERDQSSGPEGDVAAPRQQRLFFALWPEAPVRDRLDALIGRALPRGRGRRVEHGNLHITLVFLGSVAGDARACVERLASAVQAPCFTLHLDQLGYWPKPRILWAGASEVPQALKDLVSTINTGLPGCGLVTEGRPYRAHVTLARKVPKGVCSETIDPIVWPVDRFVLVESHTRADGAQYRVLRSWALS